MALSIAAVVTLSLPACGNGSDNAEPTSETSSGSTLPRNVVHTLSEVEEILPEMSQGTATGRDATAPVLLVTLYSPKCMEVKSSEVRCSKRLVERGGKHPTTACRNHFCVESR